MKPAILCLLLAVFASLAVPAPAMAGPDAGVVAADVQPAGPVSPGPIAAPPSTTLPDPIASPAAAYEEVRDAYTHVGAWFAVLVGLFMLLRAVAMRGLFGLGVGRRAAIAAGALAVLGAAIDAGLGAGTWLAVLSTALMAASLAITPTPPPPPGHGART
jgi:hypothetical protein